MCVPGVGWGVRGVVLGVCVVLRLSLGVWSLGSVVLRGVLSLGGVVLSLSLGMWSLGGVVLRGVVLRGCDP